MNAAREPNLGGRTRACASSSNGRIATLPGSPFFFTRSTSGNSAYTADAITGRQSLPLCGVQHKIYSRKVKLYGLAIPKMITRKAAALHSAFRPVTSRREKGTGTAILGGASPLAAAAARRSA